MREGTDGRYVVSFLFLPSPIVFFCCLQETLLVDSDFQALATSSHQSHPSIHMTELFPMVIPSVNNTKPFSPSK